MKYKALKDFPLFNGQKTVNVRKGDEVEIEPADAAGLIEQGYLAGKTKKKDVAASGKAKPSPSSPAARRSRKSKSTPAKD